MEASNPSNGATRHMGEAQECRSGSVTDRHAVDPQWSSADSGKAIHAGKKEPATSKTKRLLQILPNAVLSGIRREPFMLVRGRVQPEAGSGKQPSVGSSTKTLHTGKYKQIVWE